MFTLNRKDSSSNNNVNEQYINFIKSNHNMVEKHLQTEFQHPYKKSLLKSHGIIPKQKDHSYKLIDSAMFSNKNQQISLVKNRYDDKIKSMKTIQSKKKERQLVFNTNTSVQLSPVKQGNNKSRKQQIYNSLNFINPPSGKSLQLNMASKASKRSNNPNLIQRNDLISREDILSIVDEKNKQISQQLLKQRNNFSQIVYKNNHHHKGNLQKKTQNYVLERYENNRTVIKSQIINNGNSNQRYSNGQFLSEKQLSNTLQQNSSSNLLLPSIKKRSQSYRQQPFINKDNKLSQKLLFQQTQRENQQKLNKKQKVKINQSDNLTRSINQLRKQFQKNTDAIKMYKKVEKNNIALKVKQINQKNLKSYYEYENSIMRNNQLLIIDKEKKGNTTKRQQNSDLIEKQKKIKALFNDKLVQFSINDLSKEKINLPNHFLTEQQMFIRQIVGNKSEKQIKMFLGSTISSVVRSKMLKQNQSAQRYDQQIVNQQNIAQIQNMKSSTPLSPSKRFKTQLKNLITIKNDTSLYEIKINSYREFAFKIFFIHKKYNSMIIKQISTTTMKNQEKFKFYVGKGNNSVLIKSLMKRRFWWTYQEDPKKANFIWTQLKINTIFSQQKKANSKSLYYKVKTQEIQNVSSKKQLNRLDKKKEQQKQKKSPIFTAPFPQDSQMKIFTPYDKKMFEKFSNALNESNNPQKWQNFQKRKQFFTQGFFQIFQQQSQQNQKSASEQQSQQNFSLLKTYRVHNHFQFNHFMGNKKALFYNLRYYYNLIQKNVYEIIPLTFHIRNGQKDPQYSKFLKYYKAIQKKSSKNNNNQQHSNKKKQKNIWIIKPGENSNRGQGIQVFDEVYELNNILKQKNAKNPTQQHTYIVQKYIEKPLLYKNRKFDIRHYFVMTRMWGKMKAYFFGQGYIRTSSYQFDLNNVGDTEVHLTNDAIQKNCDSYGKYEQGNKLSYVEFQRYLDQLHKEQTKGNNKSNINQKKSISFANDIYPQMRNIATQSVKACYIQMDPNRTQHNFEVFGMDFMIDRDYKVWLIEINTNPCLELSSKLLERVIPSMVEQSLRLTIDILFPQPFHYPNTMKHMMPDYSLDKLKFQLIFDQDRDGQQLQQLFNKQQVKQKHQGKKTIRQMLLGEIDQQDQTYQNDGDQMNIVSEKVGIVIQ